jgi:hypothetical protein
VSIATSARAHPRHRPTPVRRDVRVLSSPRTSSQRSLFFLLRRRFTSFCSGRCLPELVPDHLSAARVGRVRRFASTSASTPSSSVLGYAGVRLSPMPGSSRAYVHVGHCSAPLAMLVRDPVSTPSPSSDRQLPAAASVRAYPCRRVLVSDRRPLKHSAAPRPPTS